MKSVLFVCLVATVFCARADKKPRVERSAEAKAAAKQAFVRETGGYIVKPDPGNGRILIANAQSVVGEKDVRHPMGHFRFHAKLPIEEKTIEPSIAEAPSRETVAELGATAVLFVRNDAKGKSDILVSPDERFAVVNVAALNVDNPGKEALAMRVRKAISRGICYMFGAGGSRFGGSLVGTFKDGVKDYDNFADEGVPPDVYAMIAANMKTLGVRQFYRTTYQTACEEGWAPAPTNEVQKAVWDKVHTLPTRPITIEPEKK